MIYEIKFTVMTENDPDDSKEKIIDSIRAAGFDVSSTEGDEFGGEDE